MRKIINPESYYKTQYKKYKSSYQKHKKSIRYITLLYYSYDIIPRCSCCSETIIEFLSLDHINGDGKIHRTKIGIKGADIYRWLIKNKFPYENQLQVLCTNCNFSKGNKIQCIHKRKLSIYQQNLSPRQKESLKYRIKLKLNALNNYSKPFIYCQCCGENEIEFLSIDHINNDGNKYNEDIRKTLYLWLRNNNYPSGFRVLCMNCNTSIGRHKYCPHSLQPKPLYINNLFIPSCQP